MNKANSAFFLFVWLMVACGSQGGSPDETDEDLMAMADSAALRVAVMPTIDCMPVYVAADLGLFADEDVEVKLCSYTAQMDCDTAVQSGWADGLVTDLVRGERMKKLGVPLHYATSTNLQWQLVAAKSSRIRQLKQLDDKMVAMTRYSATAMLTDMLVDSVGLLPERVFRIQVNDVGIRLSMLENKVMDAMLLPEPQATLARLMGSQVLYDSGRTGMRLGVIAFREGQKNDSAYVRRQAAFVRAYGAACDSLNKYGLTAYRNVLSHYCKVESWVADSMSQDIRFKVPEPPAQSDVDKAQAWLKKNM